MYNKESFCPEVWSQLEITSMGDYSICCLANNDQDFGLAHDDSGTVMNVMTHSIQEAINSKTHREHRLELSRNQRPARCRNCYDSEDSTRGRTDFGIFNVDKGHSKRQRVIMETAPRIPAYAQHWQADMYTNPVTGATTAKVVNLHLRFGNLCNMKCVMCSPQHSNLWYDDHVAFGHVNENGTPIFKLGTDRVFEIHKDTHGRNRMDFEAWWESDIWWQRFSSVMPDLKYIYFTGGEPFLVPAMTQCLDLLIQAGLAPEIRLRFDTNLSVINNRILAKLDQFKEVILCVSIDDTSERYNFIRFPGEYSTFITNLDRLSKTKIKIEYISSCIGMASIYAIPRVCDVAHAYGLLPYFRFLEGPAWLDLRYLPVSAKLEIIETYRQLSIDYPEQARWHVSIIKLLEKYLDEAHTNRDNLQDFVKYMDILDGQRGTAWRVTISDTYQLLRKHCPDLENL